MIGFTGLSLLVIGWFATHAFSEARERRKEIRSNVDKICKQLWSLEKKSRNFHLASAHCADGAREIVTDIFLIQRTIRRLGLSKSRKFSEAVAAWRASISLKNFDPTSFERQEPDSAIIAGIVDATADMEDSIETAYLFKYPTAFPYFQIPKRCQTIWKWALKNYRACKLKCGLR